MENDADFIDFIRSDAGLNTDNRPLRLRLNMPDGVRDDILLPHRVNGAEAICEGVDYRSLLDYLMKRRTQVRTMTITAAWAAFTLGSRCWERDQRIRIRIGPLTRAEFDDMWKDGAGGRALAALVRLFPLPASLQVDVQLIMRAADVLPIVLSTQADGPRLGRGYYLVSKPSERDRDDFIYELDVR